MIYLGIDPGGSGGIAFLDDQGAVVNAVKMPESDRDLYELIWRARLQTAEEFTGQLGATTTSARAVIERVHSSPQMGVSSAFTFGKGFGRLLMALTASAIPFDEISPRKWQPVMGVLYPKDATQTERKNISKARAQQLFPHLTVTHAIADALLIAEYARRSHTHQDTGDINGKEGSITQGGKVVIPKGFGAIVGEDLFAAIDTAEGSSAAGHGRHAASEARAVRRSRRGHSTGDGRPARVGR